MSIYSRFFGERQDDDGPDDLVGRRTEGEPVSLQVLFGAGFRLDPDGITEAMRQYHPSLADARCEIAPDLAADGKILGLAGWGDHVIQIVGFDVPMPPDPVEACVAPANYGQPLKAEARDHRAHCLLWYAGAEESPLEQYVALAAFAGVLADSGAVVVLNESGRTSFPAAALSGQDIGSDMLEVLRTLPLPILFVGFVKYNIPNDTHVWMRTYGAHVFGLPDLAAYTAGHHEGQRRFDMFDSILKYMLNTGKRIAAGHTMQVGPDTYLRCRAPAADEPWLEGQGETLVVETIRADQINQ